VSPTLAATLESHVAALRAEVPAAETVEAAQARLAARVARLPARPRPRLRELIAGAATACALVVLAFGPLFVAREVVAFDDVQRHFRDFATLVMTVDTTAGGGAMPRNTVTATRDGRVRVDVGTQLSVVLDTKAGRGTILLHEPRRAGPFAFAPGGRGNEALDWLEELRTYTGAAERIEATRTIGGEIAYGWTLTLANQRSELWANADGLPLEMRVDGAGPVEIAFTFVFDEPVDETRLSLDPPAGYTPASDHDED
jgi:hypothetical protein